MKVIIYKDHILS